jgi:AcrR family transcriptional regulator
MSNQMVKSRDETKQATRNALISAAIHELGAHGLDVSLDAICARARRTRGALYVHFADREALIVAVMQQVLGTFVSMLTTSHLELETSIRLFATAVRHKAPVVAGGAGLKFHHILDACGRSRALGDAYREVIASAKTSLAAAIERDQRAKRIRRDRDPQTLAQLMIVTVLGMLAVAELDLPIEIARIEQALLGLLA